jgi:hypothetical protein
MHWLTYPLNALALLAGVFLTWMAVDLVFLSSWARPSPADFPLAALLALACLIASGGPLLGLRATFHKRWLGALLWPLAALTMSAGLASVLPAAAIP